MSPKITLLLIFLCGLSPLFVACNSTDTKDDKKDNKFFDEMKIKHGSTIGPKFNKALTGSQFTATYHQKHIQWSIDVNGNSDSKKTCGVVGCHPNGKSSKLPKTPQDCHSCHDQTSKVPFRGFGDKTE